MKRILLAALCLAAVPALAQSNPFAGMKGKMKDGMWEYNMQMEGTPPGMPPGMTMPAMTFQRCLTPQDVEGGGFAQRDPKMANDCKVSNMNMSGNTASWTMECTKERKMRVDSQMTFAGDSFTMKQKMQMDQGGQMMNMNQTMTGKYKGPCPK